MRKAFKMKIYEGMAEEYKKRHDHLWPEMVEMIHAYGGSNYAIFLDEATCILYGMLEVEDEARWAASSQDPRCRKWWAYMADIMETNDDNSPVSTDLKEVFYLA